MLNVCISWGNINGGKEGVVICHTGTKDSFKMDELMKRMQSVMEELNKSKKKGKGEPLSATICDMLDIVICLASEMKADSNKLQVKRRKLFNFRRRTNRLSQNRKSLLLGQDT